MSRTQLTTQMTKFNPELLLAGDYSHLENWVNGKFTKDESSFLNALNLTQPMLTELFGSTWLQSVAIFLRGITTTSCYTDVNLITKGDCQTVRFFLEKIYYWFLRHPLKT